MTKRRGGNSTWLLGSLLFLSLLAGAANAADICKDCHKPAGPGPLPHDSGCTTTSCQASCHPTHLTYLLHNPGVGTPLTGERTSTCNTCHNRPFPGVYHPYTINASAVNPTLPGSVDLDLACGQCHGTGGPAPYYSKANLAAVADGMHDWALVRYASTFTITTPYDRYTDQGSCLVAGGAWVNGTMCDLNKFTVSVAASVTSCTGDCVFTYDWYWGDGTTTLGATSPGAVHTYTSSGTKAIKLIPRLASIGKRVDSVTRSAVLRDPDLPPTAAESGSGPCAFAANTWTYTLTDASTDDGPDADTAVGDGEAKLQIMVDWGDGTVKSFGKQGQAFSHVYARTGTFAVKHTATDSILQSNISSTCTAQATPTAFIIGGTVKNKLGTANLAGASVTVKRGTAFSKTMSTNTAGAFSFGSLTPGTYTLTVVKFGYTFPPAPSNTVVVGPDATTVEIRATAP